MDADLLGVLGLTSLGTRSAPMRAGHGSHLTGIMVNTERAADGRYFGIAPNANLVSVRAFDAHGQGTYSSVIRGIDWIVQQQGRVRHPRAESVAGRATAVALLGRPAQPRGDAGLESGHCRRRVSGQHGPGAQTITVPGNVPYVITVGAMTDTIRPTDPARTIGLRRSLPPARPMKAL